MGCWLQCALAFQVYSGSIIPLMFGNGNILNCSIFYLQYVIFHCMIFLKKKKLKLSFHPSRREGWCSERRFPSSGDGFASGAVSSHWTYQTSWCTSALGIALIALAGPQVTSQCCNWGCVQTYFRKLLCKLWRLKRNTQRFSLWKYWCPQSCLVS